MQTCKRCKCFKSCKELSKREEVQVGQFFFCFLNFYPVDDSANRLLTIFDYKVTTSIYFRYSLL